MLDGLGKMDSLTVDIQSKVKRMDMLKGLGGRFFDNVLMWGSNYSRTLPFIN